MRYPAIIPTLLIVLIGASWHDSGHASVSEVEPNSTVGGAQIYGVENNPLVRYVEEYDIYDLAASPNPNANRDPSLANALPLNDELIGQLGSTRDYDWFYVDIPAGQQAVTPVYFGCDRKIGYYYESLEAFTPTDKDLGWQIEYYYASFSNINSAARQSSYMVFQDSCKRGASETKGPFRFQMNTQRPGRYYIRLWAHQLAAGKIFKDQVSVLEDGKLVSKERQTYYDVIVAPTADYTLRLYTARVGGELEPNDGLVEAYVLSSGVSVAAQLSSMYDQDWFSIRNDTAVNTTNRINFYFTCKGQAGTSYILSSYNTIGVLQNTYEVKSELCNGSAGFSFTINATTTGNYYFSVASPTFSDTSEFTQSDYTVLAIAGTGSSGGGNNPPPETPSRRPGDLEPNEKVIDAVPLTKNLGLTGQLSSITDLDWYSIDYVAEPNATGFTTVTFACKSGTNSSGVWELSAYNSLNAPQAIYSISVAECAATGGFRFTLSTPATGRYPILINAKPDPTGASFSQADYTLRWSPILAESGGGGGGDPSGGGVSRLPGDMEPNDTLANAFPLTSGIVITGQLAAADDLDYYYLDNDTATNPAGFISIYFGCKLPATSPAVYSLSYLNALGQVQQSYKVSAAQCSSLPVTTLSAITGGFRFDINTPNTARYYLLVAGPGDSGDSGDSAAFSDADYTLSTFLDIASQLSRATTGRLTSATIIDNAIANRDSFTINLARCGQKGAVRLTGKKLNLSKMAAATQVLVQIGDWSCVSDTKQLSTTRSDESGKTYVYPPPPIVVDQPVKKPKIIGN